MRINRHNIEIFILLNTIWKTEMRASIAATIRAKRVPTITKSEIHDLIRNNLAKNNQKTTNFDDLDFFAEEFCFVKKLTYLSKTRRTWSIVVVPITQTVSIEIFLPNPIKKKMKFVCF